MSQGCHCNLLCMYWDTWHLPKKFVSKFHDVPCVPGVTFQYTCTSFTSVQYPIFSLPLPRRGFNECWAVDWTQQSMSCSLLLCREWFFFWEPPDQILPSSHSLSLCLWMMPVFSMVECHTISQPHYEITKLRSQASCGSCNSSRAPPPGGFVLSRLNYRGENRRGPGWDEDRKSNQSFFSAAAASSPFQHSRCHRGLRPPSSLLDLLFSQSFRSCNQLLFLKAAASASDGTFLKRKGGNHNLGCHQRRFLWSDAIWS